MKIKVCGMKYPENIEAIQNCQPDFIGHIFYEKSPRYMTEKLVKSNATSKGKHQTVGVFVNSPIENVLEKVSKYELDYVQLHGDESVEYIQELYMKNVKVIKAFRIDDHFNWTNFEPYESYVNYFLLDTSTKKYGGSGLKFDWNLLKIYNNNTPFFLSGGIEIDDVQAIKNLNIPQLYAIDINSKFETEPGVKNIELVKIFISQIRNES